MESIPLFNHLWLSAYQALKVEKTYHKPIDNLEIVVQKVQIKFVSIIFGQKSFRMHFRKKPSQFVFPILHIMFLLKDSAG